METRLKVPNPLGNLEHLMCYASSLIFNENIGSVSEIILVQEQEQELY